MDAVALLEARIANLRHQQRSKPRLSAVWWTLQEDIDRLDADAKTMTARQREEIVDRNAERLRAALKPSRRFVTYPVPRGARS